MAPAILIIFAIIAVGAVIEHKLDRLFKTSNRQKISTLKMDKRAEKSRKQKNASRRKSLTLS